MNYLFYVVILSIIPILTIFTTPLLPHTHDGLVHLARIAAYFKALQDLQIPVRWAGDLNYGYGMPLFNFMYPLPYLISSIFVFLGFGLVSTFKIILLLSFVLSGIFMYMFSKEFFEDDKKAFLVTVFYQFAPFRFVDILIRGGIGEIYTYAFLPLVLFGVVLLPRKQSIRNFVLTAAAAGLLIMSHNSISLVFFAIVLLFAAVFSKRIKDFVIVMVSLGFGLGLSAFYFIPAIIDHRYTYGDLFMKNLYLEHFGPILNFFIPNFLNSKSLQVGGVSVQIGLFHVAALFVALVLLLTKKKNVKKRLFLFSLFSSAVFFFFMTPLSKPFWENISLLRQFQFPWRFLAALSFCTSIAAVSFLHIPWFKKKFGYVLLIALVVSSTAFYWRPILGYDKVDENYYWSFPLNTTYYGETDVIWSEGPAKKYPKNRIELVSGKAKISGFVKKSNKQTFNVNAETDVSFVSHTQYFPGWKVFVDGKPVPFQFQDPNHRGLIEFDVSKGSHNVKVAFGETKLRLASDFISLGAATILAALYVASLFKKKFKVAGVELS